VVKREFNSVDITCC